jgi:hypothetical protein
MKEYFAEQIESRSSADPAIQTEGICRHCREETYDTGSGAKHSRTGKQECRLSARRRGFVPMRKREK